ncbi:MAG: hypothetical protein PHO27_04770 [Sulfuricurvum sp.]|nr:hypothetical protein [Sulfuricurvum sp.]
MIYLITALDAEARTLVEHYRLKRDTSLPYTLYRGDNIILLVCGMGKMQAAMSVSALLGWKIPNNDDILINIGICGAPPSYSIGEVLLVHKIIDGNKHYYPDILYTHSLRETSLLCVDSPQESILNYPVDMESGGIFLAASKFFKLHQMAFIKIVSDHCEPNNVTKEGVINLIHTHLPILAQLFTTIQTIQCSNTLFSTEERMQIEVFKTHFTKSQGDALEDALSYFRLKNPTTSLRLTTTPIPDSKRERSELLESFIITLTA